MNFGIRHSAFGVPLVLFCFFFVLVGCGERTKGTPPGRLGAADFPLPAGITAPAELKKNTGTITICLDPKKSSSETGAALSVEWQTFEANGVTYITHASVDLTDTRSYGFEVTLGKMSAAPNTATIALKCREESLGYSFESAASLSLGADNRLKDLSFDPSVR